MQSSLLPIPPKLANACCMSCELVDDTEIPARLVQRNRKTVLAPILHEVTVNLYLCPVCNYMFSLPDFKRGKR